MNEKTKTFLDKKIKEQAILEFQEAAKDLERNKEVELWDTFLNDGLNMTDLYEQKNK